MTRVSWQPLHEIGYDDWARHGSRISAAARSSSWWIADWVLYGTQKYGGRYKLAVAVTGYDDQTLMNMVWVASQFEISRRRENLSFSHHAEVASLPQDQQEYWLDRAEGERLSVRKLRNEIAARRNLVEPTVPDDVDSPAGADAVTRAETETSGKRSTPDHASEAPVCPHCGMALP